MVRAREDEGGEGVVKHLLAVNLELVSFTYHRCPVAFGSRNTQIQNTNYTLNLAMFHGLDDFRYSQASLGRSSSSPMFSVTFNNRGTQILYTQERSMVMSESVR